MTNIKTLLLLFSLLIVFTAGCLEEPVGTIIYEEIPIVEASTDEDPLAQGKRIFVTFCQGCHAETGKGIGMPNQPDFTDASFFERKSDEELINSITNGVEGSPMPPWGPKLSGEEIQAVQKFEKSFAGM